MNSPGGNGPDVLEVRNALFSLSDAPGPTSSRRALAARGATVWATEGTAKALAALGSPLAR